MKITLPDESIKELPKGVTGLDVAESIGPGLAKSAIAVSIDGIQKDLSDRIDADCALSVITVDSDEGLEIMRHTVAAQVLALAIKNIYPDAKLAIGPTIENGCYYDFLTKSAISSEDLPKIEKEMKKIIPIAGPSITKKEIDYVYDAIKNGWYENAFDYIKNLIFEKNISHVIISNAKNYIYRQSNSILKYSLN